MNLLFSILKYILSIIKNTKVIGSMARLADIKPLKRADFWPDSEITVFAGSIDMVIKSAARIGPVDAIPTRPKEFSSPLLSPLSLLTPSPRTIIKGVVIAPVVAPDASKAIAWPKSELINIKMKITP